MSAVALNRISIALGFIGLFVAGYLSLGHILNIALPCGVSHGCDVVAVHPTSYLTGDHQKGGIPVAYLGVVGYLVLTILAVLRSVRGVEKSRPLVWIGFIISAAGSAYSGFLTYTALYTIHATCIWCIASAITMVLTTIVYAAMLQTDPARNVDQPNTSGTDLVFASAMFLLAALALGGGMLQLKSSGAKLSQSALNLIKNGDINPVGPESHILGKEDAPVTIVEFADLLCPSCQMTYPKLEEAVKNGGGKVRLVFHHFPLIMKEDHKMAMPAATIAEIAAEEGKFWNYIGAVYSKQNADLQTPDSILDLAKQVGLDVEVVKKRLLDENDKALKRVIDDFNLANRLKISATPTIFIMAKGVETRSVEPAEVESVLANEPYKSIMAGATAASN